MQRRSTAVRAHVLATGLALCAAAQAQDARDPSRTLTARGIVFEDRNADGVRQSSEPGIPGVAVSNAESVVLTDERGRYELAIDADDSPIFVIKPRGYQVRIDAQNLPRFYYLHKPEGTPDDGFHFRGVAPTGPLPASVDFPLTRVGSEDAFTALVFGDPQPYSVEQIMYYRREVVEPLADLTDDGRARNAVGASLGISLGDLVGDDLRLFEPLNQAQAMFGVPWYNVYGNHDMNAMAGASELTRQDPDRWADDTFERIYGPANYAFQQGRVHFIMLDDVVWQGYRGEARSSPEDWPVGVKPDVGNYRGGLRDFQLAFIENYLQVIPADDLVVLCFHIPVEQDGEGVHRIPELDRLLEILSSHPNTLSISGHTHFQRHWFFGAERGYAPDAGNQHSERFGRPVHHHINAATVSGSWYNGMLDETGTPHTTMRCGSPNGYTLVRFEGNRYRSEFYASRRPTTEQMAIYVPFESGPGFASQTPDQADAPAAAQTGSAPRIGEAQSVVTTGEVIVNVYHGAEGDAVEMRIVPNPALRAAPGPWTPLAFSPRIDPMYDAVRTRELAMREGGRGWGLPQPERSHHIWAAPMPTGLPPGTHTIEVRHTDLYGITRTARKTVRIG